MTQQIKVLYHDKEMEKLGFIEGKSDWIDLRAAKKYRLKAGEFKMINLGVSMELPKGYEAHVAPRSSTYKNYKIIQVNSVGVIDNSFSGSKDIWHMPVLAMEDTVIEKGDRICQFRIMKQMEGIEIVEVEDLEGENRGGFGSTGVK